MQEITWTATFERGELNTFRAVEHFDKQVQTVVWSSTSDSVRKADPYHVKRITVPKRYMKNPKII